MRIRTALHHGGNHLVAQNQRQLGPVELAVDDVQVGAAHTAGAHLQQDSYVEFTTQVKTAQMAGLVFDQYAVNDYKFVAIDVVGQRVVVGHQDPTRGMVIEQTIAKVLSPLAAPQRSLSRITSRASSPAKQFAS